MNKQILSRRSFLQTSVAAGGGLMLGFHMPVALAASISPQDAIDHDRDRHRDQRLDRDRQGQHGHAAHPAHRAGPGRRDVRGAADRRGAQRRLVEDQDRVRRRQPASAQQQRIQGDEHARLAARAFAASAPDGRRRVGARAPQAGGGGGVGHRPFRDRGQAWRAHGGQPHRDLWRVRRSRGQGQARQGAGDPDRSGQVVAARPAEAAPRHPEQGQRQRAVRDRHAHPRHGLRRREGEPGAVGHAEELQLRRHQGTSGRHRGRATQGRSRQARPAGHAGCRRGCRRQLVSRQDGA